MAEIAKLVDLVDHVHVVAGQTIAEPIGELGVGLAGSTRVGGGVG